MQLTREEQEELMRLTAKAVGAGEDFSQDHMNILIRIGQGMFWDRLLDEAARELAQRFEAEFEMYVKQP